jgi:hypothetical protein
MPIDGVQAYRQLLLGIARNKRLSFQLKKTVFHEEQKIFLKFKKTF